MVDWSGVDPQYRSYVRRRTGAIKAPDHRRYGEGKIHRLLYSRENRFWYIGCRGVADPDPRGMVTMDEVTCKRPGCR